MVKTWWEKRQHGSVHYVVLIVVLCDILLSFIWKGCTIFKNIEGHLSNRVEIYKFESTEIWDFLSYFFIFVYSNDPFSGSEIESTALFFQDLDNFFRHKEVLCHSKPIDRYQLKCDKFCFWIPQYNLIRIFGLFFRLMEFHTTQKNFLPRFLFWSAILLWFIEIFILFLIFWFVTYSMSFLEDIWLASTISSMIISSVGTTILIVIVTVWILLSITCICLFTVIINLAWPEFILDLYGA